MKDILIVNSGRDYKHLSFGAIPVFGTGGYMLSVDDKLSDRDGIGLGRKGTINKPQYLNAPFWTVDTLFYLTSKDNNSLLFQYYVTQSINWLKFDESTGVPSLSKKTIESIKKYIPSYDEQIKNGEFFKKIDSTIELHQRRLNIWESIKKEYINVILPSKEHDTFKLRFNGYEKIWKNNKISELVNRFDNLRIPVSSSDRVPGETPYYGANGIQDYVEGHTHNGEFILIAEDGANNLRNYPVHQVDGKVWVNNHAHVLQGISELADNSFLMYTFKSLNFAPYLVGGSRFKLNADTMMKINIKVPHLNEQKKIGEYFTLIDNHINMSNKKIRQLQKIKKIYLSKMFL